jgi:zinc transport system ATP-binding protein
MSGAAVVLRDVTVTVAGRRLLEEVSFEVARGELCCLCGPNGGGKTTLLRAVLGLLPLAAGSLEVLGSSPPQARRRVGYLPQAKAFNPDFPARALEVILANRRGSWPLRVSAGERARAREALSRLGGERLIDAPLRGLSGGELQRVFLARALVNEPELLLLDEPTAGVDARGRSEFLELLGAIASRGELAVVLVTHNAGAVRALARRVVYLDRRLRAWGTPAQVLDRQWGASAFGHDHEAPEGLLCEDD